MAAAPCGPSAVGLIPLRDNMVRSPSTSSRWSGRVSLTDKSPSGHSCRPLTCACVQALESEAVLNPPRFRIIFRDERLKWDSPFVDSPRCRAVDQMSLLRLHRLQTVAGHRCKLAL